MAKTQEYECAVPFDACRYLTIKAGSPEEAAEKALDKAGSVSLCHQCTDEIEVGEPVGVYVRWGDNSELDTTLSGERIRELQAQVAAQAATLATVTPLVQQLVNALEQADADSQEVLGNYRQLYSERYRPQRLEWQEGVVAWNAKAITAARAFLSGATKESTDA